MGPMDTHEIDHDDLLQEAIQAIKPDRAGDEVFIWYKGCKFVLHPLTQAMILRSWADAICGAAVAKDNLKD